MLKEANLGKNGLEKHEPLVIKRKVYERILQYLACEGIGNGSKCDCKEANRHYLVFTIISAVIAACSVKLEQSIRLYRGRKQLLLMASVAGFKNSLLST